jgi:mutual gliding-motility protein MglA
VQFNVRDKEVLLKIVYYGPALSGKTTNIQALHGFLAEEARGRLMNLDTRGDRTLFFDLLPVHFVTRAGYKVKLKLFTVPGQVMHESTRRIVLAGTDAVCFIADSQKSQRAHNNEAYSDMVRNLRVNAIDPGRVPIVIQFNKRDMPDVLSDQEIAEYEKSGREPIYTAIAIRGIGVVETLRGCVQLLWNALQPEHDLERKLGIGEEEFLNSIFGAIRTPASEEARQR